MRLRTSEFNERVRRLIVLYVADADDYAREAEELSLECSDAQWNAFTKYIQQIDIWLGMTDKGTLREREAAKAYYEKRPSRYPGVLLRTAFPEESAQKIAALESEFGVRDGYRD